MLDYQFGFHKTGGNFKKQMCSFETAFQPTHYIFFTLMFLINND